MFVSSNKLIRGVYPEIEKDFYRRMVFTEAEAPAAEEDSFSTFESY